MIEFTLFGIQVRIEPWHWISLALIGMLNAATPLGIALFVLAGFFSILVHEYGHALTIRHFKQPTAITLSTFGGYATYPVGAFNRVQQFIVSFAGPAVQIVLGLIAWAVYAFAPLPDTQIKDFFGYLALVSIVWAILNLFPVYPLDGGHMLKSILGPKRESIVYLLGVILPILFAVILMSMGMVGMTFPIFMALFAWQNFQRWQQNR